MPWSSIQAACQQSRRAASISVAMSAIMKLTPWCIAIGTSKVTRSFAYSTACSYAACATPTAPIAVPGRVASSVAIAILKPSPSSPSRFSAGHAHVLEREGRRVGRALPHLVEVLLDRHAGRVHRDDERRHARWPAAGSVFAKTTRPLRVARVRDERLRAVEDVLVALAHSRRLQRRDVGARARLGETEASEDRLLRSAVAASVAFCSSEPKTMTGPGAEAVRGDRGADARAAPVELLADEQSRRRPSSPSPPYSSGTWRFIRPDLVRLRDHARPDAASRRRTRPPAGGSPSRRNSRASRRSSFCSSVRAKETPVAVLSSIAAITFLQVVD